MPVAAPPPAPRPFPLRALDAASGFLLLFGAIWFAVGTFMAVILTLVGGPLWNDLILDRRGVAAQATPTAVEPTSASVNHQRVFGIRYTFIDATGTAQSTASETTNRALVGEARRHSPLAIEYDPGMPHRSRLRGERASMIGLLVLLPVGFALIGVVVMAFGIRRAMGLRHVYVRGKAGLATVTGIAPTSLRVNGKPVMRIDYVFETIMGQTAGRTTSRTPPPIGATLWVLYDESDPRRSVAA